MDDDGHLFVRLHPALRRFAAAVRPAHVDADDLVQEALARTLRRHRLAELDDPLAYLRRAVLHLAANQRRSWARRAEITARQPVAATHSTDAYSSDLDELLAVPPGQRAVIYLHVVELLPHDDIAALLGITPDASRARLSRGLRQLRIRLTEPEPTSSQEVTP